MDPYGTGPGYPRHPAGPGHLRPHVSGHERVGNAQRTTVLDLLSRAVAEGYLDLDEYELRVVRVTEGKTVAQLYGVVSDLPPPFRWDPVQPMPKSREERDRESAGSWAIASLALGAASIPISLCFGAGGIAGIAAVILARKGLRDEDSRSKAVTGMVLGTVGIAVSFAFLVMMLLSP